MSVSAAYPLSRIKEFNPALPSSSVYEAVFKNTLNREISIAPKELMHSHAHSENLWNVAKNSTIVAYLSLSAAAFVATSLFAPSLILMVTFSVFLAVPTTVSGFNYAEQRENDHSTQKMKYARIAAIQEELKTLSPEELADKFAEFGISKSDIDHFDDIEGGFDALTAGLAMLLCQCECTQQIFIAHRKLLEEIQSQPTSRYRGDAMREAYYKERATLASHINAAYLQGLLKQPYYQGSLDDIGGMPLLSAEDFALEKLHGQNPDIFVFKENTQPTLKDWDIELPATESDFNNSSNRRSLEDLGNKIFAAVGG